MPRSSFAYVIRNSADDAAMIAQKGTKAAMLTLMQSVEADEQHSDASLMHSHGVTRLVNGEELGDIVAWNDDLSRYTHGTCTEPVDPSTTPVSLVKDAPVATPPATKQEVVITEFLNDDKVRLTPNGAKFCPIILFRAFVVVDDVLCIVGEDVEYKKERVTPVTSLAKVEVKSKRYVEVDPMLWLDATPTEEARVTPVKVTAKKEAPVAGVDTQALAARVKAGEISAEDAILSLLA